MNRRDFLLAAAMISTAMGHATAQQAITKKRLAMAAASTKLEDMSRNNPYYEVFFEELKRAGFVEGENLLVDRYSAEGRSDRYESLAREVVATNPDVIYTGGTPMTLKLKAATSTIPIVTATGDPIRFGIVSSLAHPGGNITGVSVDAGVEIWGKRLELLSEAVPNLKRVAFISTQGGWNGPGGKAVQDAAPRLGISLTSVLLTSPYDEAEYRRVLGSIHRDEFDGIMFSDENEHNRHGVLIAQLIHEIPLPAIYNLPGQAEAGGLMSYAWDGKSVIRRNAIQIAEILRGANPADMPYFQVERFDLVINLKAAKELGLEIPAGLIAGATAVIE